MLKRFLLDRPATHIAAAQAELAEAKLAHLKSQSDAEYAAASVLKHNAMAEFHLGRITRLTQYLVTEEVKQSVEVIELSSKDWNGD